MRGKCLSFLFKFKWWFLEILWENSPVWFFAWSGINQKKILDYNIFKYLDEDLI